jgi:hypothetical protein
MRKRVIPQRYTLDVFTVDFFNELDFAGGLRTDEKWRREFESRCWNLHAAFNCNALDLWLPKSQEDVRFEREIKRYARDAKVFGVPEFLIMAFAKAGGIPRGSWEPCGRRLGGPFYRFVRSAYPAIPPSVRPKTADQLCRLCREILQHHSKEQRKKTAA